jgi:hypothetical protein
LEEVLEEILDLSSDRILNELINPNHSLLSKTSPYIHVHTARESHVVCHRFERGLQDKFQVLYLFGEF